ncbi:MAG: LacI family DNA-binding transcriptional regulator [Spirochaetes bacterium]|uniref:LacI family DNA-binding transcriptional regulator n=1 Tax=Candidatus Ornithospirochaeta stercoripullorum TaxID=2840899 RepID=A0A9D9E0V6_9SPIO|nr:LacI family DNA-binding transcriptional regulator [Candidatus Ornithospirochaeta stercoripullorum]
MSITMKELAAMAGVSCATVSKVLNRTDHHISKAKTEEILALAKKYDYTPNVIAKALKVRNTRTIGFMIPDIRNPFFPGIVRGIEDEAMQNGYSLIISDTDNDPAIEADCFQMLQKRMVSGIIFTRSLSTDTVSELLELDVPVVLVDRMIDSLRKADVGQIFINLHDAFFAATGFLISRSNGPVAFICADEGSEKPRFNGYCDALSSASVQFDPSFVYIGQYDIETGADGVEKLLSSGRKFGGLMCGNDLIAIGAMNKLREMGFSVPGDVKVVGCDDIEFSALMSPSLTTLRQPTYEYGRQAARMLIDNIEGRAPLSSRELDYTLVIRESCR